MQGMTGATETLGTLTLTADSIIDFGAGDGDGNTIRFTNFTNGILGTFNLTILNWTGPFYHSGDDTDQGDSWQDRLVFDALTLDEQHLSQISFYDNNNVFRGNAQELIFGVPGGGFELVPVPEPTTPLGGLMLVGLLGYRERRAWAGW